VHALNTGREVGKSGLILLKSGNPWTSSDMVSFTKATALGEFEIISDDVENLTLRKPKSFREVCEQRLASLKQ
jgi:hypothetical protein